MRNATFGSALAATLFIAASAFAQDVGISNTVESVLTQGITGAAGSAVSPVQRDVTGVLAEPEAAQAFATRETSIQLADPTTLIGLPLVTNDAAIVGKIQGVEIGEAGEPKALVVVLYTATGNQEIRLPVELTTRQSDGIQVQANEADVRAFFSAETPVAEPRFALQNEDPGLPSIAPTSREAITAPGTGSAVTVAQTIRPVQTLAERSPMGPASAWEATVSELNEGQVPSSERVGPNGSRDALPRIDSQEVAAGKSSAAEPAVRALPTETDPLAKQNSASEPQLLLLIGLAALLLTGIASLASGRWRNFLARHLGVARARHIKSKRATRPIPSPG
jgi:hypothetical protein